MLHVHTHTKRASVGASERTSLNHRHVFYVRTALLHTWIFLLGWLDSRTNNQIRFFAYPYTVHTFSKMTEKRERERERMGDGVMGGKYQESNGSKKMRECESEIGQRSNDWILTFTCQDHVSLNAQCVALSSLPTQQQTTDNIMRSYFSSFLLPYLRIFSDSVPAAIFRACCGKLQTISG